MAELIQKFQELQSLPPELHWFCEAYPLTDSDAFRVKSEFPIGHDHILRRDQAAECLTLYGYEDATSLQQKLGDAIDTQLSRCDLCIESYYRAKEAAVERLKHDYEEGVVRGLEKIIDARDIERIKRGLDNAARVLRATEPSRRSKAVLHDSSQLVLFEALNNKAFLGDRDLVRDHFQEPFSLIQTNSRLKTLRYVPAATIFLFDRDDERRDWATQTWSRFKIPPTKEDFQFAIRGPLYSNMQLVCEFVDDLSSLERVWQGIGFIVSTLTNDLVTHSLRAMEIDLFKLALEHLKYDTPGFRHLVETIQKLLELAPKDFWDAMGAISPTTFVEQIFNNKQYERFIEQAQDGDADQESALRDMLSWIKPFMASLETVHQARACRSITFQLMNRLQTSRFPNVARVESYRIGLATLLWTLSNCNKEGVTLTPIGRVAAAETLEVASEYVDRILQISSETPGDEYRESCAEICLRIAKTALALECKSLRTDQETLKQKRGLPATYSSYSPAIWDAVVRNLSRGNLAVAKAALIAITDLTGLEKFKVGVDEDYIDEKNGYNMKFGRLTHLVCQILERINDFSPSDLDKLFRHPDTATALVASLFSPDASLYEAGVNLIKSISSEYGRKEAIGHLLKTFFETTLNAFSWSLRRIARSRTFASCPRMLKTSSDVLDILCDSQDGLLRTRQLTGLAEVKAIESFWEHQWEGLRVIYEMTEDWGKAKVADSNTLKEFCRDTMQFSERFFDQYSIFANAIESAIGENEVGRQESHQIGKKLLKHPATIMETMVKWLRLRDLFLVEISVKLTKKVLNRLSELSMVVSEVPSRFLEAVINNGPQGRTHLTPQEKAELSRALEANIGRNIAPPTLDAGSEAASDRSRERSIGFKPKSKTATIDLESWRSKAKSSGQVVEVSDEDEFGNDDVLDQEMLSVSRSVEMMKKAKEQRASTPSTKQPQKKDHRSTSTINSVLAKAASKSAQTGIQTESERALFREKREKEREAKKKRDADALAMVKRKAIGAGGQVLGEGSGISGIGVKGKDHAPKGPSMMVSSGSETESGDELDEDLFGSNAKPTNAKVSDAVREYQANKSIQAKKGPVKKTRQIRSAKDMRARLAPDLTTLHKTLLSWDFFHTGDFPPSSEKHDYSLVTNTFRTPNDYQNTFEPLLILEAWQGFLKSKEEGNFKTFEIKVANRMTVDAFLEVSSTMSMAEGKDLGVGEADIVLISRGQSPTNDSQVPHCLARIHKISRKKGTMEVSFRVNVGNSLGPFMVPNAVLYCVKISSVTPLEREYGALCALRYFDLCDEITKAKPSPVLSYSEKQLSLLVSNYCINIAQAKAVRSAVDNDAFTLIQGPPGSGKTKTIVAIVGALLTGAFSDKGVPISRPHVKDAAMHLGNATATKKLLICAPSNAAVDELVMRLKLGVKTANGEHQQLSVVRIGRSDAINTNVLDVTLEELVNAKLNIAKGKKTGSGDEVGKIMAAHKTTCEELSNLRNKVDESKAKGIAVQPEVDRTFEVLKRRKQQLSNQIDAARDNGSTAARDTEISRRRIQQEILDGAHVICATLSGSGHEMFQGLNIEFGTVIIDEAAQSIELSALIPLKYGCFKCILVGDPKQLPPTVLSREAARFSYEQSLFVRMQTNHPNDVHLLDTQYRMHPEISSFPSKSFYENKLLDGPRMAKLRARPWHQSNILGPYRFFDVQGTHQSAPRGHSLINIAEIEIALKLFDRLTTDCRGYDFKGSIGIITPYKSQLRELRSRFAQKYGEAIFATVEFNTTDAFQGRESEVIIFSCVRASFSQGIGFLADIRRMNVGITRAKSSLWVLGNSKSLMRGEYWSKLIEDAKSRDRYTGGDLFSLLGKPLVKYRPESTKEVPTAPPDAARSVDGDIEMPDANCLTTSGAASRYSPAVATFTNKTDESMDGYVCPPSGGANGLNDKHTCATCGSFAHWASQCDNQDAIETSLGRCYRCDGVGHGKRQCTAEKCLICGKIGHDKWTCTSTDPLTGKERERITRQEIGHKMGLQMEPETRRKKQLGDHDRQVPVVRSTSSTPSPDRDSGNTKRQASPPEWPVGVPSGPRPMNPASKTIVPIPLRKGSKDSLKPYAGGTNGHHSLPLKPANTVEAKAPRIKQDIAFNSSVRKPGSQHEEVRVNGRLNHCPPRDRKSGTHAANGSSNIIKVGERPPGPSNARQPPPLPENVKPPKRKREADPFIRPPKKR